MHAHRQSKSAGFAADLQQIFSSETDILECLFGPCLDVLEAGTLANLMFANANLPQSAV